MLMGKRGQGKSVISRIEVRWAIRNLDTDILGNKRSKNSDMVEVGAWLCELTGPAKQAQLVVCFWFKLVIPPILPAWGAVIKVPWCWDSSHVSWWFTSRDEVRPVGLRRNAEGLCLHGFRHLWLAVACEVFCLPHPLHVLKSHTCASARHVSPFQICNPVSSQHWLSWSISSHGSFQGWDVMALQPHPLGMPFIFTRHVDLNSAVTNPATSSVSVEWYLVHVIFCICSWGQNFDFCDTAENTDFQ